MAKKTIEAADLFCGAGGTSTGLIDAAESLGMTVRLRAVNHWNIAIDTHTQNHPGVEHYCHGVGDVSPEELVPGRILDLLVASPECTHHSRARGGKPRSEQKRADAWLLLRWVEKLYVRNLIIENVPEMTSWGPLKANGTPDKRHAGMYFNQFIETLRINYRVEWEILNAADYGDATSRQRLFIICRRPKHKPIVFPEPTHASRKVLAKQKAQPSLFGGNGKPLQEWRSAREIIDWDLPGTSIFGRKKPLSENTMRRIFAGLFKYSLKPFVLPNEGFFRGNQARDIDEPIPTVTQRGGGHVVAPFLVNLKGSHRGMRSIDEPTITQAGANQQMLIEPLLVNLSHTKNDDGSMCKTLDNPLGVICGKGMLGLIEPFLVKYYGTGGAHPVTEPLDTVTTKDRYGLCIPQLGGAILDIRFRMLQPHELAAAMGFPKGYSFAGKRDDQVKQIGNAVPVNLASALCRSVLAD